MKVCNIYICMYWVYISNNAARLVVYIKMVVNAFVYINNYLGFKMNLSYSCSIYGWLYLPVIFRYNENKC